MKLRSSIVPCGRQTSTRTMCSSDNLLKKIRYHKIIKSTLSNVFNVYVSRRRARVGYTLVWSEFRIRGSSFHKYVLAPCVRRNTRITLLIFFPPRTPVSTSHDQKPISRFPGSGKEGNAERPTVLAIKHARPSGVRRWIYIYVLLCRPYYRWSGLRFTGERIKTATIKTVRVRRDERGVCTSYTIFNVFVKRRVNNRHDDGYKL